jgi:hypothetical protein
LNICEIAEPQVAFADRPEIITHPPIITIVGKAFFDIGHAPRTTQTGEPIFGATPDSSGDETRRSS